MKVEIARNIAEYISFHPEIVQVQLKKLHQTIKKAAPLAEEMISYQMPAFKFHRALVYFAAYKNHIGFYPTGSSITSFKKELSAYESSKGTVRFPIDKPLPLPLIARMVKFRVKENLKKKDKKASSKSVHQKN